MALTHQLDVRRGFAPGSSVWPLAVAGALVGLVGVVPSLLRLLRSKVPVMLHRAVIGSFERFIGILVEQHAGAMSGGEQQMLAIARAMMLRPRLMLLDEPFSGLDAINQGKLERLIRDLAAKGTTVIFSTHVIAHAERLCDDVAIIAGGKLP